MFQLLWALLPEWEAPLAFIVRHLYALSTFGYSSPSIKTQRTTDPDSIRIVAIADTHNAQDFLPPLPTGDVLIHAGDLSNKGTPDEIDAALAWLAAAQPHPHKIFIAGNHDYALLDAQQRDVYKVKYAGLVYLQDEVVILNVRGRALSVYGNAQTPAWLGTSAFVYPRVAPVLTYAPTFDETQEGEVWGHVPEYADVFVTHGPPLGMRDRGKGCAALRRAMWRVRPRLHVFGHIHEGHGVLRVRWSEAQSAYERVVDGVGTWSDVGVVMWGVLERVREGWEGWIGRAAMRRGVRRGEIVVANVASRNRPGDDVLRNAKVFDI